MRGGQRYERETAVEEEEEERDADGDVRRTTCRQHDECE